MACALRLARFNVMIDAPDQPAWRKSFFVGMPAPAGAIVGLLPIYVRFAFGLGAASPGVAVDRKASTCWRSRFSWRAGCRISPASRLAACRASIWRSSWSESRRAPAGLRLPDGGADRGHPRLHRLDPVRHPTLSVSCPRRAAVPARTVMSPFRNLRQPGVLSLSPEIALGPRRSAPILARGSSGRAGAILVRPLARLMRFACT